VLPLLVSVAALARPPCDPAGLQEGVDALASVGASSQVALAAAAIAEACPRAGSLRTALAEVQQVPPDFLPRVDAQLAVAAPADWTAACRGGPGALADAMQRPLAEQRPALWEACAGAERGHFSAAEWSAAPGLAVAPILLGHWLVAVGGVSEATARIYARALAGISDRPEDDPVRSFRPLVP
jgi:hypothetical protein